MNQFRIPRQVLASLFGVLGLSVGLSLPAQQSSEGAGGAATRVAKLLEGYRERFGWPGMSVAFIKPDGDLEAVTVGLADVEADRQLRPEDRLMSGSIGKTYVAALAMQFVAEDDLDLDLPISKYLGEEDWFDSLPNAESISARQLMNHSSGIPEHVRMASFGEALRADVDRVWTPVEMLAFVFDAEPLFPAGEGWSYADTNYVVLGMILEKIGGQSYYELLQARILDPLELKDTVPTDAREVPGLIPGYCSGSLLIDEPGRTIVEGQYRINPQFEWTGGGLACTTSDLVRWCHAAYAEERAFPAEFMPQVLDALPARTGPGDRYGLGVQILETAHGTSIGHSGIMPGYLSIMAYYPELGVSAALQINTDVPQKLGMRPRRYLDEVVGVLK